MLLLVAVLSLSLAAPALSQACTASFCQHGGVCVVVGGSPSCACPSGFTGRQCETVEGLGAVACAQNPCLNGGTCAPSGDQFKCLCAPGWIGTLCQASSATAAPSSCPPNSQNQTQVQCKDTEIVFMLEYAKGMTIFDIDHEGDFIKTVIDAYDVASGQIRVGVVAYHDTVYEAIHLDDFEKNSEGLMNAVTDLTRSLSPSGSNDLAAAFDYVKLTSFANTRPDAIKVVLPIVHMMPQSKKSGIVDAAARLKADCVTIIGSGIKGSREEEASHNVTLADVVDRQIMEQVVSPPSYMFYWEQPDFTALENAAIYVPKYADCP